MTNANISTKREQFDDWREETGAKTKCGSCFFPTTVFWLSLGTYLWLVPSTVRAHFPKIRKWIGIGVGTKLEFNMLVSSLRYASQKAIKIEARLAHLPNGCALSHWTDRVLAGGVCYDFMKNRCCAAQSIFLFINRQHFRTLRTLFRGPIKIIIDISAITAVDLFLSGPDDGMPHFNYHQHIGWLCNLSFGSSFYRRMNSN